MQYDVITIGGATEDIIFYTKEGILIDNKQNLTKQKLLAFEYGAKIKIDKTFFGFGGGGANTAVSFSRFGFKTAVLTAIGDDDRGQKIINNFEKQKVDVSLIQKIKKVESSFSFILAGLDNEHIVFSSRTVNDKLQITNNKLQIIKNANFIYLTSLSGEWPEALSKFFSLKNIKIVWNPGHRQILAGVDKIGKYLAKTAVLIINKDEAIELVMSDKKYKNQDKLFFMKINNLLSVLCGYGPQIVLITNDEHGASAFDTQKFYFQPSIKLKKIVNTIGVGDAFGSAFMVGLKLYNNDIEKALYLGAKNAASVITQPGAQNGLITK
ncbi:MAG: PfkB family carbohydrate kinase [Patescibacteria group bacterium]|nr:hypothetical protein [Patescibacteria group bacterium]MBU1870619.1 hypothetical protein [Patescibacteria group bacterium]